MHTKVTAHLSPADVRARIRAYIIENFLLGDEEQVDCVSFVESGILDSTGMFELVAFVESEFGIELEDRDLVPDNVDSVERLEALVIRKHKPVRA